MPETTETLETTPLTTEQPQSTEQDTSRAAVYEKYYGGTQPPVESVPVTEPVAQTVTDPAPAAPVAVVPPEVLQLMTEMRSEIQALKTQLTPAVSTATTSAAEPSWIAMLREGRIEEAEAALADSVAKRNQNQIVQEAVQQERIVRQTERVIENFLGEVRAQNQDLLPMEEMIAADVQRRISVAQNSGKLKTTEDVVKIYKDCVNESVSSARKLYHQIRGDGKQEAMTRNREVLSSQPIRPQQVDTARTQAVPGQAQEPAPMSDAEYLQRRQAVASWHKGLAPKPDFLKD